MDSAPNAAELIAQLADLQVRFVTLDPAALTTTDLALLREQLAIVEKQLCAFEHARPKRQPATPSTLRSLLTLARADLAAALGGDITPAEQLTQIIDLTVRLVPGTQHASVAVLHDNDRLETLASTSSIAVACDHAQRNGEGPCFALNIDRPMLRIDDLRHDTRWPGFAARAAELCIRSTLVCELPAIRRHTATLNLYCARRSAFRAAAELVAPVFASRAAIALAHTTQVANLHTAINSRQVIGEAVGILMERHRLTEDEAFQRLVTASQHQHIKLRELATRITQTGEDPDTLHT